MSYTTMQGSNPRLTALALALALMHPRDRALRSAVDRLLEQPEIAYAFDGVELRVVSFDPANAGMYYISDGITCTCKGGRHRWCKHRVLFRCLCAEAALTDPAGLRCAIAAQYALQEPDAWNGEWGPVVSNEWGDAIPAMTPPSATVVGRCRDQAGCLAQPYAARCRACQITTSEEYGLAPAQLAAAEAERLVRLNTERVLILESREARHERAFREVDELFG